MQSLPCEILQLVAGNLLPRYQCRFALTSRQNYGCLYSPLLRWHAQCSALSVPRYKHTEKVSLIEFNKQLVLYDLSFHGLSVANLTTLGTIDIEYTLEYGEDLEARGELTERVMTHICRMILHDTNILTGCYKYIHKMPLLMYLTSRNPLLRLPHRAIEKIKRMIYPNDNDFAISSVYIFEALYR